MSEAYPASLDTLLETIRSPHLANAREHMGRAQTYLGYCVDHLAMAAAAVTHSQTLNEIDLHVNGGVTADTEKARALYQQAGFSDRNKGAEAAKTQLGGALDQLSQERSVIAALQHQLFFSKAEAAIVDRQEALASLKTLAAYAINSFDNMAINQSAAGTLTAEYMGERVAEYYELGKADTDYADAQEMIAPPPDEGQETPAGVAADIAEVVANLASQPEVLQSVDQMLQELQQVLGEFDAIFFAWQELGTLPGEAVGLHAKIKELIQSNQTVSPSPQKIENTVRELRLQQKNLEAAQVSSDTTKENMGKTRSLLGRARDALKKYLKRGA